MSKHTPGPWLIEAQNSHTGAIATVHNTTDVWVEIWSENWIVTGMGPEEQSANARLIAAAPELLESLEYAIRMVPELATVPGVKAAIAKATGETP
jgi:hypothetical protein